MSSPTKPAGFYALKKFQVASFTSPGEYKFIELARSVVTWSMSESMFSPYLSGVASVIESFDTLKKVPMRGEEVLTIEFIDYFDNVYTYQFYVYAVTNLKRDPSTNGKAMTFDIHFCSFQKLESDKFYVMKSFGDEKVSDMAEQVFDRYFPAGPAGVKELETMKTDNKQTVVIPRLRSDEAMQFLARRAKTQDSPSSLFTFFENREKYYFAPYEHLVKKYRPLVESAKIAEGNDLKFIFHTYDNNEPEGQRIAQFTVQDLEYQDRSNSIKALKDGAYKRAVRELDYYNRTVIREVYDYLSDQPNHEVIDNLTKINTDNFVSKYMPQEEAPEVTYVTDYNQLGLSQGKDFSLAKYRNYRENFFTKTAIAYHLNNSSISCIINGQGKLMAGMMIWLEVYDFAEGNLREDLERSGRYLVTDVTNIFSGDYYKQKLKLTKGGLREV